MNDSIATKSCRVLLALAIALVLAGQTGCERKRSEPAPAAAEPAPVAGSSAFVSEPVVMDPGGAAAPSLGDAAALQALLGDDADEGEPKTEADKAWRELRKTLETPPFPPEWQTNRPSEKELADFEKGAGDLALKAADQAKDFYTRYPEHPRAGQARSQEQELLTGAAMSGQTNALARLQALEEARLKDPTLSDQERLMLRVQQLQRSLALHEGDTNALLDFEKGVRSLQKDFPKVTPLAGLLLAAAEGWTQSDPQKGRALAKEVADSVSDEEVKEAAQGMLKKLERIGQPLAIKFTSIDGRAVDLQQLKGKVVLVDFWATWCAPCMRELPNVKAAYEKLHARGFEIIGISLDHEKAALQRVVEREKLPWPQYFDDSSEGNKLAEEFGIEAIPTMWLVNTQGKLCDLNARENMAAKVEKLLAEK